MQFIGSLLRRQMLQFAQHRLNGLVPLDRQRPVILGERGPRLDFQSRIAQLALGLGGRKARDGAVGNQLPLLLGQCRIDVQHEVVDVLAQRGHYERYPVNH